ncbi:MAG: hypothetical protein HY704_06820 [Gemmatimonadetes bacterium]|nr:hypothetical protein [Gemmatimonadota bacterium]
MLSYKGLLELDRALRHERALTVYIDGTIHDPAARYAWRKKMEHGLHEIRHHLQGSQGSQGSNRGELEAFERAAQSIAAELGSFDANLSAPGWVGFATAGGIRHAGLVPVSMPDLVWWGPGIRVAPYVRALKQERPVIAALVDSRRARIFRYWRGELEEEADLRADTFLGDLSDVSVSKRANRHSGVRGITATDEADRQLQVGLERMLRMLGERVSELADGDGWIVFAGTPEVVKAAEDQVPERLRPRLLEALSLQVTASSAEVRAVVKEAAKALRESEQVQLVGAVIDAARANGKGVVGIEPTLKALEERRVERLFLSRSFIARRPEEAERAVKAAFDQDAVVEATSGAAAERLETEAEGIGARLRFVVRQAAS